MQRPTVIEHLSTHWSDRGAAPIRAVVLHHTAGTDSLAYLTANADKVSTHTLISKRGTIYRMVPDRLAANTVGFSNLGTYLAHQARNPNIVTLNVELENTGTGRDPYPDEQITACGWQIAQWWEQYGALPILTHALIDTNGKSDPLGLDLARVYRAALAWYDGPPAPLPITPYTEDSPLLAVPSGNEETFTAAWLERASRVHYDDVSVVTIARAYWKIATAAGLDPWLAAGQCMHESGWLSSFWCSRPQRNPAGLGVTGEWRAGTPDQAAPGPDWAYNTDPDRRRWERGLSFPSWAEHSVPAHVGRLLAYAVRAGAETPEQKKLIEYALQVRSLPAAYRGVAPTLRGLDRRWAVGVGYGGRVAAAANRLRGIVS